ncbi:hypothetical protein R6Q59_012357 [Mikania micrantha]
MHIVRLLGFCSNHETNSLVYEYMPDGSLGEMLHGKIGGHLHWGTRIRVPQNACMPLLVLMGNSPRDRTESIRLDYKMKIDEQLMQNM